MPYLTDRSILVNLRVVEVTQIVSITDSVRLCLPGSSSVAAGDDLIFVGYVVKSLLVFSFEILG